MDKDKVPPGLGQRDISMVDSHFLPNSLMLKPKLDSIFAEVESCLPSIDFDLSDVSSEEDVPIFQRTLKTPTYDEEEGFEEVQHASNELSLNEICLDDEQQMTTVRTWRSGASNKEATRSGQPLDTSPAFRNAPMSIFNEQCEEPFSARTNQTMEYEPTAAELDNTNSEVIEPGPQSVRAVEGRRDRHAESSQLVSMYLPATAPQIEEVNIDVLRATLASRSRDAIVSHNGDGATVRAPCRTVPDDEAGGDSLSLIEKLAGLAKEQSGVRLSDVHPVTGAVVQRRGCPLKAAKTAINYGVSGQVWPGAVQREGFRPADIKPGDVKPGDVKPGDAKSGNMKPGDSKLENTKAGDTKLKTIQPEAVKTADVNRGDTKPTSPPLMKSNAVETVFMDLRDFDKTREEAKQNVESVRRVLNIQESAERNESSSDSDVDTELWHERRSKVKDAIRKTGSATGDVTRLLPKATTSTPAAPRPAPPRLAGHLTPATHGKTKPPRDEPEEDETTRRDPVATPSGSKEDERMKKHEMLKRLREQREQQRQSRVRLGQRLEALRPTGTESDKSPPAEATPTLFDVESSYEPAPRSLPDKMRDDLECVLLAVHLSCNGDIVGHRSTANKSVDTAMGLSATYTTLLTWLLSLVPDNFGFIKSLPSGPQLSPAPFHVLAMQQVYLQGQMALYVAVAPVEHFTARDAKFKAKRKDEVKDWTPFQQILAKFLSVNTLQSVCPWLQDMVSTEMASPSSQSPDPSATFVYRPPLPSVSSKPLSAMIQIKPDRRAAERVLDLPVSFFWETLDADEGRAGDEDLQDEEVSYEIQNTMSLVYKRVYRDPRSMMGILNRVLQEGLDLAGFRLVYPAQELMTVLSGTPGLISGDRKKLDPSGKGQDSDLDTLNNVGPILAFALRGRYARSLWLDAVGPSDPALARRTDPNSLCALYGGQSRDECLLFCPRNPARIQTELCRWFGGRVPESGVIDVGRCKPRRDLKSKKSKKSSATWDRDGDGDVGGDITGAQSHRPPATLTAMTRSDVILVVSPLVATRCLGLLLATCQRRGYQLRGVRRLRLTHRRAVTLGVNSRHLEVFVGESASGSEKASRILKESRDALLFRRPSTVLVLRKESAQHAAASLTEALMVQMCMQDLLRPVQGQLMEPLGSGLLFHTVPYSDAVMAALGGNLYKVPPADPMTTPGYIAPQLHTHPELEQVVVLTLTGHVMMRTFGLLLGRLLGVVPHSRAAQPAGVEEEGGYELLGLKWLPSLSANHAKALTPFEVGERDWKASVHLLTSEPAVVLALRTVNAFRRLRAFLSSPASLSFPSRPGGDRPGGDRAGDALGEGRRALDRILSPTAEVAYRQVSMFFRDQELFADPEARVLLPFLPPAVAPSAGPGEEWVENDDSSTTRRRLQRGQKSAWDKPLTLASELDEDVAEESIMQSMLCGPRPITTVLVAKPDVVHRHLGKLLKRVFQEGFRLAGLKMMMLTAPQAAVLVPAQDSEDDILTQMHIDYLTSAPCLVLCLLRENAVKRLLDLLGPEDPQEAKRAQTFSWRAVFGSDVIANGLHGATTYEQSLAETKLFFPEGVCCKPTLDLQAAQINCPALDHEAGLELLRRRQIVTRDTMTSNTVTSQIGSKKNSGTSAPRQCLPVTALTQSHCVLLPPPLLNPDPRSRRVAVVEVLEYLLQHGFEVVGARALWLTRHQAEHVLRLIDVGDFAMVPLLTSGPSVVLALQRDNAVMAWDTLLGTPFDKDSIYSRYGNKMLVPKNLTAAHTLLTYFFDRLAPGAQLQIVNQPETTQ